MRLLDRAATAFLSFLGVALIAMVCLTVYNVISRYVFNSALLWGDEIAVYAMIALAWLGAVVCAWRNAEIRMDILINLLGERSQRLIQIAQQVLIAGLCGWVAWQAVPYILRAFRIGMRSDAAGFPIWLIHAVIPFSLTLIAVIAVMRCVRMLTGRPASFEPEPALPPIAGATPDTAANSETSKGQVG